MNRQLTNVFRLFRRRRILDRAGRRWSSIGRDTRITGGIADRDNCVVHGRVNGEVRLDGTLVIAQGALVEGAVRARNVIVAGEVRGDIQAARRVEIQVNGVVTGDLDSPAIAIARGARHDGEQRGPREVRKLLFEERRANGMGSASRR
jgi:cytoskeletal protein CcmA (bactofilin family)